MFSWTISLAIVAVLTTVSSGQKNNQAVDDLLTKEYAGFFTDLGSTGGTVTPKKSDVIVQASGLTDLCATDRSPEYRSGGVDINKQNYTILQRNDGVRQSVVAEPCRITGNPFAGKPMNFRCKQKYLYEPFVVKPIAGVDTDAEVARGAVVRYLKIESACVCLTNLKRSHRIR